MAPSRGTPESVPEGPQKVPRNPMPLSATHEQQVRDLYHKRVRGYCAEEIKQFAICAKNRTVTATWKCRQERLAMNSCMIARATPEEQDAARGEWLATRLIRKKEREEKDRQSKELQKMYMEWQPSTERARARRQDGAEGNVGG